MTDRYPVNDECAAGDGVISECHRLILKLLSCCKSLARKPAILIIVCYRRSISDNTSRVLFHFPESFRLASLRVWAGEWAGGLRRRMLTDVDFNVVVRRPLPPQTAICQWMIRSLIDSILRRHLRALLHCMRMHASFLRPASLLRDTEAPFAADGNFGRHRGGQPRSFVTTPLPINLALDAFGPPTSCWRGGPYYRIFMAEHRLILSSVVQLPNK